MSHVTLNYTPLDESFWHYFSVLPLCVSRSTPNQFYHVLGKRGKVTVTFTSPVLLVLHHVNSEMCWKLTNSINIADGLSLPQYIKSNRCS